MVRLVSGVSDKLCSNCYGGGVTKMDKLPQLKDIYICSVCSGTEYFMPGQADQQPIEEEED
ncbi:MAG: hypothetical protein ACRD47_05280 [Nitrososphaeraceae archaeon]